jgi:hypothetical protein
MSSARRSLSVGALVDWNRALAIARENCAERDDWSDDQHCCNFFAYMPSANTPFGGQSGTCRDKRRREEERMMCV